MNYTCPSCKSDNIQRLSVIYNGGLSIINTTSSGAGAGVGPGGVGIGVGGGNTTGTSQTMASKQASPPPKKSYLKPLAGIFALYMALSLFTSNWLHNVINISWLVISAGWCYYAFQYNQNTWPKLKAEWDNSFFCNRCGNIFVI